MKQRLFALASATALTGFVSIVAAAGCDSAAADPAPVDGDAEAGKPDTGVKGKDVEVPDADPPPESCAQKDPVNLDAIPYVKAKKVAGACSATESSAIKKFIDDAIAANKLDFKQSEWAAVVSPDCASCVFTNEADAEWGVIISKKDDPEEFLTYNRGGCVEVQSNKEACGKAYQAFQSCAPLACDPASGGGATCKDQDEFDECIDDDSLYTEGACKEAIPAVQQACGNDLSAAETACKGGLPAFINAHCIAPKGVDAGDGG